MVILLCMHIFWCKLFRIVSLCAAILPPMYVHSGHSDCDILNIIQNHMFSCCCRNILLPLLLYRLPSSPHHRHSERCFGCTSCKRSSTEWYIFWPQRNRGLHQVSTQKRVTLSLSVHNSSWDAAQSLCAHKCIIALQYSLSRITIVCSDARLDLQLLAQSALSWLFGMSLQCTLYLLHLNRTESALCAREFFFSCLCVFPACRVVLSDWSIFRL